VYTIKKPAIFLKVQVKSSKNGYLSKKSHVERQKIYLQFVILDETSLKRSDYISMKCSDYMYFHGNKIKMF